MYISSLQDACQKVFKPSVSTILQVQGHIPFPLVLGQQDLDLLQPPFFPHLFSQHAPSCATTPSENTCKEYGEQN